MPLLRLGPLSLPTPGEVVDAGQGLVAFTGEVLAVGGRLPAQVTGLLDEVTRLVGVLGDVATRVYGLLDRAEGIVDEIEGVLGSARRITSGAEEVVDSARTITSGANDVVDSARSITSGASEVVDSARSITAGAEEVVGSARSITSGANDVVDSARRITAGADEAIGDVRRITTGAGDIVEGAGATSRSAQELLDLYRPLLERGAPLAGKFVDDLTPEEVDAAIKLVDQLPQLTESLTTDIIPILETLDRVGPDIHELLDVTKDLRQAIDGVPGLSFFRRRGEAKDDARAEEEARAVEARS